MLSLSAYALSLSHTMLYQSIYQLSLIFTQGRRAQLDRENAHFILSEAMIGTLEQLSFDTRSGRSGASPLLPFFTTLALVLSYLSYQCFSRAVHL